MLSLRGLAAPACSILLVTACGDGTGPDPLPTPTAECSDANLLNLAVGSPRIIDPAERGSCIRVPAAGSSGANYLYVALATEGTETPSGVEDAYALDGGVAGSTLGSAAAGAANLPDPTFRAFQRRSSAEDFHLRLRQQERTLAQTAGAAFRFGAPSTATAAAVAVGDSRTFQVCSAADCQAGVPSGFAQTTAKVKYIGNRVVIYLDDNAPAGGYTDTEVGQVGALFDDYLYPIDTTAFGRESDVDDNTKVVVLLTQYVNQLSPNCNDFLVLGYFFGGDLYPVTQYSTSNDGEIFYGFVPDPTNGACPISKDYALRNLPPTFIHEFQHMISYNQHVLKRSAAFPQPEDVWLNEGLSHYAEELGGRQVPNARCVQGSCLSQFVAGDLVNAYNYLANVEENYLVAPGNSSGSLEERGAGWLFVRWLADQFGTDSLGRNVTRALDNTGLRGGENVAHVADEPFSNLVPLWQLANYLDDLPGFTGNAALQYRSWNFRTVFGSFHTQDPINFPDSYPLKPDNVTAGGYTRSGVLRAGSGRHALLTQPASGEAIDLRLAAGDGESLPPAAIAPRIAVVRIR